MDVDNSDNSNNNARFKSMDIENTVSAFALIFAAAFIALILLFIEVRRILLKTLSADSLDT